MTSETDLSPKRRPTGFDNGQYSQSLHASRGDLRHALEDDKLEFLTKEQNFWSKLLFTDKVEKATVDAIGQDIKNEVALLCKLAKAKNPLESKMYPPLTKIFNSIKRLNPTTTNIHRFWKDHHTQYPGVDSGVYISGLEGKEKPVVEGSYMESHTVAQEGPPTKKVRTNKQAPDYKEEDSDPEGANHSSARDAAYRPPGDRHSSGQFASDSHEKQQVFDARKPDWILLDGDSDGQIPDTPLWRQIAVIMELKGHSSLAPDKKKPSSSLIVQCVDYARLHLALRPFQRFSLIFSLCGTVFTAWLVDRTGVVISDNVDIKQGPGLDTFIRAIAQVSSHLTMYELGMDPTVAIHGNGSMGDPIIPRFAVTMPSHNVYITRGIPIWQSASIFGRGTVVWTVEEQGDSIGLLKASTQADEAVNANFPTRENPTFILKTAYRNEDRLGESDFYLAIKDAAVEGLAVFREGGDVEIPEKSEKEEEEEGDGRPGGENNGGGEVDLSENSNSKNDMGRYISSQLHRKGLTDSTCKPNTIAHRLVLESKGRRLTEHGSLVELLEAILASVKGHESLYNLGILHRDISIGNVFMSQSPTDGQNPLGFLADLDMAKVYDKEKLSKVIGEQRALALVKSTNSGSVTGTAQFMSLALLREHALAKEARQSQTPKGPPGRRVSRWNPTNTAKVAPRADERPKEDPMNDLESFMWVLLYALCVKEMNSQESPKSRVWYYSNYFNPIFGAISFEDTHKSHAWAAQSMIDTAESARLWRMNRIPDENSWTVLESLVQNAQDRVLDHKLLKEILEHYIAELKDLEPAA